MNDTGAQPARMGVVQRAFQLARSGRVASIAALNEQLAAEGYVNSVQTLAGRSVRQQLLRMISESGGAGRPVL